MTKSYSLSTREVGTGASYGALVDDEHASLAVKKALINMSDASAVSSVLLFLTGSYAHNPQGAIKEAAKAAGTTQVFGCCAMGLLTEQEWLLDVEGAVAMVFPQGTGLHALHVLEQQGIKAESVLTLSTPNAVTMAVNAKPVKQIGAITTDEYGHGPFSVWQSGRIVEQEFIQCAFAKQPKHVVKVASGVKQVSPIMQINRSDGHSLFEVNQQSATDNLHSSLPEHLQLMGANHPFGLLCAVSENSQRDSIEQGHYKLHHIISSNTDKQHILLSGDAKAGRHLFWGIRDQEFAQEMMREQLLAAKVELGDAPKFAFMFPNIGRGAEFFNGRDRDLELFNEIFPNTPLIGFYGNGEIAPGHTLNGLIHRYSTVFGIYA